MADSLKEVDSIVENVSRDLKSATNEDALRCKSKLDRIKAKLSFYGIHRVDFVNCNVSLLNYLKDIVQSGYADYVEVALSSKLLENFYQKPLVFQETESYLFLVNIESSLRNPKLIANDDQRFEYDMEKEKVESLNNVFKHRRNDIICIGDEYSLLKKVREKRFRLCKETENYNEIAKELIICCREALDGMQFQLGCLYNELTPDKRSKKQNYKFPILSLDNVNDDAWLEQQISGKLRTEFHQYQHLNGFCSKINAFFQFLVEQYVIMIRDEKNMLHKINDANNKKKHAGIENFMKVATECGMNELSDLAHKFAGFVEVVGAEYTTCLSLLHQDKIDKEKKRKHEL